MTLLPDLSEPQDVVPVEIVDAMVTSVRFDLAMLADNVQRAETEALELEQLAANTSSTVPAEDLVILDRLSGYFDQQAVELDARRSQAIARGQLEAEARLARATEEAARLLGPTSEASEADGSFMSLLTLDALPPATDAAEVAELEAAEPELAEPEVAEAAAVASIDEAPVIESPSDETAPPVEDAVETDPTSDPVPFFGAPMAAAPATDAPATDAPAVEAPDAAADESVDPHDADARFSNFWEEQHAAETKRETAMSPSTKHLMVPMIAIVLIVTLLVLLVS